MGAVVTEVMKKFIIAAVVLLVLAGAGVWFGRPAYRQMKEHRAMTLAREFLQKGDFTNALLSVRRALQANAGNVEACAMMADFAEQGRSPYAVVWRRRVAELAPTLTNRLVLAACALRFEAPPFPLAEKTLKEVGAAGRSNAAYHVVSSEMAIKLNRLAEAALHLQEAAQLEPENELHQMNLAVLRLQSKDAPAAVEARSRLASLRDSPKLGDLALRSLVADSLNRKELEAAERFSNELLARTNAVFSDRTMHLTIMREKKSADFPAALAAVQGLAATNGLTAAELCAWMTRADMPTEALAWGRSLAAAVQSQQPVPVAVAECFVAQQDWKGLEAHLQGQSWGDQEFLRLALLARALERQDDKTGTRLNWQKAARIVSDNAVMMSVLVQMADGWGWKSEAEELLWSIVTRFPGERWAIEALDRFYYANGNTRGLHKVCATLLNRQPADPVLKNNLAMYCFLLKIDVAAGHEYAREVYRKDPKNPGFASTYAFSLHLQGKNATALKTMEALKPEELEKPSTAAYYGIMLAAAGETEKAQRYLALAEKATLLPEEKALIEKARAGR